MNKNVTKYKGYLIAALAIVHTLITFITDKTIFTFPQKGSVLYKMATFDYVVCKLLCFVFLLAFYWYLWTMLSKDRKNSRAYQITVSALPYLIVILAVAAVKFPQGFLSNDEYSIYNDAVNLTHSTWFCILTPYYYTVSLMALPVKYAPIIFKLVIEFFTVGYVSLRSKEYFGQKIGLISYLLFLLYPVIAYTTSAHRLPVYFLIYLIIFSKLTFDGLEERSINVKALAIIMMTGAVLTQWRTEGIYLSVLIPIVVFITYRKSFKDKKLLITGLLLAVTSQIVVAYPQNAFMDAQLDDAANDRMKPFYAYTITNMYRNGLDFEKNKADLEIVDRYMSLEAIKAINEHFEDINYEDVLILYQDGFVGVREDASIEDFVNYSDALKRIFKNNPDVFIKTRIGAFKYAALPYHIEKSGSGVKSLISLGISIVKSISYNLFIPHILVLALLIVSLIRRKWYDFFVAGGLLCHWFIVFILAPASYFKYYFPIYIMAYFYLLMLVMNLIKSRNNN